MSVFGGLLLLHLIHDSVDGEAEAGHAWQVTDGDVELQCAVFPRVIRASAALAAHCGFAQQLCTVEEACSHLDLGGQAGGWQHRESVILILELNFVNNLQLDWLLARPYESKKEDNNLKYFAAT